MEALLEQAVPQDLKGLLVLKDLEEQAQLVHREFWDHKDRKV